MIPTVMLLAAIFSCTCFAQDARGLDPAQNLALGKTVIYCPAPNYSLTAKGDTDATDLTNGELTKREDQNMWFESGVVGWSYPGRVNLAVDLGQVQPIDEVAIRFLGGSPQAGVCAPGWVEVMVSDSLDGPYFKVAEFSKWTPGDRAKYGFPRSAGKSWVHPVRFTELKTSGRFVGIRFYGTGLTCSDEMYVFKGEHDVASVKHDPANVSDFTVTGAQLYFHKPVLHVAREIAAPVPIGIVAAPAGNAAPMTVSLDLPDTVKVVGGSLGGVSWEDAQTVLLATPFTRYTWEISSKGASDKVFGRLYLAFDGDEPLEHTATYRLTWGDRSTPDASIPIEFVDIPEQPVIPKRLMASMSWGGAGMAQAWPEWDKAFRHIGFNTITPSGTYFTAADQATIDFISAARDKGYKVQIIDSTWHRMLSKHKDDAEIYAQFEDGTHGGKLCPSYRGEFYTEELERVATAARLLKPDYIDCDIELWGWRGPTDAPKCMRCQADKEQSGIESWEDWQLKKGEEMWIDLHNAVQGALEEAGAAPCEMAVYDFRPGRNYQFFWPFDRLYPKYMNTAQVSTYTPLDPYHLELVGNEVREDREKLLKSDQMPWLTPGDAGTFSGEALYYAVLECLCNGSRGTNFWSNRVWDADCLAGYARAIRAIAPVEDIIIDGDLFLPQVEGVGRVSGMKSGDEIVLLVADYRGDSGGTVNVKLDLDKDMKVFDLDEKKPAGTVKSGGCVLPVELGDAKAKVLHLKAA